MYKDLQRHIRHLGMNIGNLVYRKLASQDHTTEAHVTQPANLIGRAIVSLCRGMKGNRRKIHLQNTHILHQNGINTNLMQLLYQLFRC